MTMCCILYVHSILQTNTLCIFIFIFILYTPVFYAFYKYKHKIFSDHMQSPWTSEHPSALCCLPKFQ